MENIKFWLLPVLTFLVIIVNYRMNLIGNEGKKDGALREACWWGGSFFVYGIVDYFLLAI